MSAAAEHRPLDGARHAEVVAELCRHNPRTWSALFRPGDYLYDERDQVRGTGLDSQCQDLRLAFQRATEWKPAMMQLRRLVRLDEQRRKISIGVRIDGRVLLGEAI